MSNAKKTQVPADDLNSFTGTLSEIDAAANGYGTLESAVVTTDLNGVKVTATYDGRDWMVSW